jgi:micrococcal nuclease
MKLAINFGISLLVALPAAAAEPTFSGEVVRVSDGDTISVMHNQMPEKIRLNGIDAPEKNQAFGMKAKQYASSLCFGKAVTVLTHGHDRYGRTIGDITLPDGRNLNVEMVKAGMAWWYFKYAPNDTNLAHLEQDARKKRFGLWQDPHPIAPWDWRHSRQGTQRNANRPATRSRMSHFGLLPTTEFTLIPLARPSGYAGLPSEEQSPIDTALTAGQPAQAIYNAAVWAARRPDVSLIPCTQRPQLKMSR